MMTEHYLVCQVLLTVNIMKFIIYLYCCSRTFRISLIHHIFLQIHYSFRMFFFFFFNFSEDRFQYEQKGVNGLYQVSSQNKKANISTTCLHLQTFSVQMCDWLCSFDLHMSDFPGLFSHHCLKSENVMGPAVFFSSNISLSHSFAVHVSVEPGDVLLSLAKWSAPSGLLNSLE